MNFSIDNDEGDTGKVTVAFLENRSYSGFKNLTECPFGDLNFNMEISTYE